MTDTSYPPIACIVLAAGQGTRMKSDIPKVLHQIAGAPLIQHVLDACDQLTPEAVVVVVAPHANQVIHALEGRRCVVQAKPLGTGDAVKAARQALDGFEGDVIVLFGADPFVFPESLRQMQTKKQETGAAMVVAGFELETPGAYGRLILDSHGALSEIVEHAQATADQRAIKLCNGGIMLFDAAKLWKMLDQLRDNNSKNEFFLTDCVAIARRQGDSCAVVILPADEFVGVDNRVDLAHAEKLMQRRLRAKAMLGGATLTDPESVFLCADTKIGRDVTIGPNVVIGPKVDIADRVEIRAFCVMDNVRIEPGAIIGPFARLRPGAVIGAGAHIGNFVEIKNSEIGAGTKVNHLSYIGDATVGPKTNVGAGTITANYDGFRKMRTHVGADVSTGANSVLVAPVTIGDGAYIGAGSVITTDVPANALAVARGRQANMDGWAQRVRDEKSADKQKK